MESDGVSINNGKLMSGCCGMVMEVWGLFTWAKLKDGSRNVCADESGLSALTSLTWSFVEFLQVPKFAPSELIGPDEKILFAAIGIWELSSWIYEHIYNLN
jgi:hypothetical protein